MKKTIVSCLITIFGFLLLTGCGKSYAGTYQLEYSKFVGDPDTAKNTSEVAYITLNDGGLGISYRDGLNHDVVWEMNGEKITLTETLAGIRIEYNGTLKDGKLILFNGDESDALTTMKVYNLE